MLLANNPNGQYSSYEEMRQDYPHFAFGGIHTLVGIPLQELQDWYDTGATFPVKCVEVDVNHVLAISAQTPKWLTLTVREWVEHGDTGIPGVGATQFHSDEIDAFRGLFNNNKDAALAICNIFKPKWDRYYADPNTDQYIAEVGNEHPIDPDIANWYFEIAREIKRRYGTKILLGAFSKNSGGYNNDPFGGRKALDAIVDHLLIPAFKEGLRVVVSLHAYSSGFSQVGNQAGFQHGEVTKQTDLLSIPPTQFSLNTRYEPEPVQQEWTGFAPGYFAKFAIWRMQQIFYGEKTTQNPDALNFELYHLELVITEAHIDRMGPWADGTTGGGMHEWKQNGAYDFQKLPFDELMAESLWRYEQYYRLLAMAGITLHGIHPFTYDDASGHWTNFLHKFIMSPFLRRVLSFIPDAPELDLEKLAYPAIKTAGALPVNYREYPNWHDATNIRGTISPKRAYRVRAQRRNADGERWWETEVMQSVWHWVIDEALDSGDGLFYPITQHNQLCENVKQWEETVPEPELPNIDGLGYCAVATTSTPSVRLRQSPTVNSEQVGLLDAASVARATHRHVAANGDVWLRLDSGVWCAHIIDGVYLTRVSGCEKLPAWESFWDWIMRTITAIWRVLFGK